LVDAAAGNSEIFADRHHRFLLAEIGRKSIAAFEDVALFRIKKSIDRIKETLPQLFVLTESLGGRGRRGRLRVLAAIFMQAPREDIGGGEYRLVVVKAVTVVAFDSSGMGLEVIGRDAD
jgi:hypothetical protein